MADKPRKVRSDKTVGKLEKNLGLPPGTVRNPDGRDTRSDKKLAPFAKNKKRKRNNYGRLCRC